ncbi:MAG TPA: DUF3820 family protein [Pseudomonadales bacterium]|nr:DUF3820 family protein [Pseudomonadales bacterium]
MLEPEHLLKIANTKMPFGKYAGRMLIEVPEEYLLWFAQKGFPRGELGELMNLVLMIKTEGLENLVKPLKKGR